MGRVLLVDSNNLIYRYHDTMKDARGPVCYTGGLYGLITGVKKFLLAEPSHDAVVYVVDKGVPAWRGQICPEYKQQRRENKTPGEVLHYERYKEQVRHTRNVIRHTGCAYAYAKGYEGDDVIAALTLRRFAGHEVTIYSSDRDYVELVDKRVRLFSPIKNIWEPEDPYYTIERCLDPKASDNLDGVPGVGKVGAAMAIQLWQFDSEATRDPKLPNPFPRSSGKALEDFLAWCGEHAKWGLTDEQIKKIPDQEDRARVKRALAEMSKDQRAGYKAAAKIVRHTDKVAQNYECTSLRWVAKLCDPEVRVIVEPPNRDEFRETMREYGLDPLVQGLPALWPVFERLKSDRLVAEVVTGG